MLSNEKLFVSRLALEFILVTCLYPACLIEMCGQWNPDQIELQTLLNLSDQHKL